VNDTPNSGEVFNDLNPQEIETLGAFCSYVETNPDAVAKLDLPSNIDHAMLQRVWGKIEQGTRQYAESTSGH
jgi:hypothetical protein